MRLNMQAPQWYAFVTRPRAEKQTAESLASKGYEYLLPVYSVRSPSSLNTTIEKPLFPGYLFCYFDPQNESPLVTTANLVRIVGFGGRPAPLSDHDVFALRTIGQVRPFVTAHRSLVVGQQVTIQNGPLKGLRGVIEEQRKRTRLIVNIFLLQRSIAVEIDRATLSENIPGENVRCLSAPQP